MVIIKLKLTKKDFFFQLFKTSLNLPGAGVGLPKALVGLPKAGAPPKAGALPKAGADPNAGAEPKALGEVAWKPPKPPPDRQNQIFVLTSEQFIK